MEREATTLSVRIAKAVDVTEGENTLQVFLTSKCNMDCSFCCVTDERSVKNVDKSDLLVDILKNINEKAITHITWFGGEPLLEIDFLDKILDTIKYNYPNVTHGVVTNGILLKTEMIPTLEKIDNLSISVDGYKESERPLTSIADKRKWGFFKVISRLTKKPTLLSVVTYEQLNEVDWYADLKELHTTLAGSYISEHQLIIERGRPEKLSTDQVVNLVFGFKTLNQEIGEVIRDGSSAVTISGLSADYDCKVCKNTWKLLSDGSVKSTNGHGVVGETETLSFGCHSMAAAHGVEQYKIITALVG